MKPFSKVAIRFLHLLLVLITISTARASQTLAINFSDTWRYNIPASDPGTTWRTVAFNDSAWSSGPGLLGFETAALPPPGIQTPVGTTGSAPVVYLFRKTFVYNGDPTGVKFTVDHIVDDGVTYYLNGNLLGSVRHTPGTWNSLATVSVGNAVEEWSILTGNATGLVNGTNVLSAEVHQIAANNSDMVFGARLTLYNTSNLSLSAWRTQNFGSSANSGNGADLADPDGDGMVNLMEFGLDLDPNKPSPDWGSARNEGLNQTLTYTRRKAALSEVTFSCQWAATPVGPWSSTGVTELVLSDNGTFQVVKAQVALNSAARKFLKLNVALTPTPAVAPCWKTFMTTYVGGGTWSDGGDYHMGWVNQPNRPLPPVGVTVTNIQHIKTIIDYWSSVGGTHISFPLNWEETEPKLGQFEFRQLDWLFTYATSKGIKCNIYVWPILGYDNPAGVAYEGTISWKYEKQDIGTDANGVTVPHFMSLHSSRMSNYYRWLNAVGAYLAPHWNAGQIGYVGVVTTKEKEMTYPLDGTVQTDFSSAAIAAYQQWHLAEYGTVASNPYPDINSSATGKRFYKFKNAAMIDFVSTSNRILKQYAPMRCVWDAGSFTDGLSNRNAWAVLAGEAGTMVDGYKHNPDIYYPAAFDTRAVVGVRGWGSMEWTNSTNGIPDDNQRKSQLISQTRISIDAGANDISFAFYDQLDQPSMQAYLGDIVQNLKNSGHWTKPVPAAITAGTQINVSVSTVMSSGYGSYHPAFDSAFSSSGIYPNIKVTNDLP